jgi:hypothetical protein
MKLLKYEAIKETRIPLDHLNNIDTVKGLSEDETTKNVYVFEYGRIIGIQEERARRRRQKAEAPILINSFFEKLFKELHEELYNNIPTGELDDFFQEWQEGYYDQHGKENSEKVNAILKAFIALEKMSRVEEASN